MAYLRWDGTSDWYVFWESSSATTKEDERLAIWHRTLSDTFSCSYRRVQEMLVTGDFSAIPGYLHSDEAVVRQALASFVGDLDLHYERHDG